MYLHYIWSIYADIRLYNINLCGSIYSCEFQPISDGNSSSLCIHSINRLLICASVPKCSATPGFLWNYSPQFLATRLIVRTGSPSLARQTRPPGLKGLLQSVEYPRQWNVSCLAVQDLSLTRTQQHWDCTGLLICCTLHNKVAWETINLLLNKKPGFIIILGSILYRSNRKTSWSLTNLFIYLFS